MCVSTTHGAPHVLSYGVLLLCDDVLSGPLQPGSSQASWTRGSPPWGLLSGAPFAPPWR